MYKSLKRQVQFASSGLKFRKQLLIAAVMLLGCLVVQAQTIFPVQSTTRILPPYSVYLADYAVNGNDKLQCILVNRDATQTTYQVRLRLTVKLNGTVIMRTSGTYNPAPITLTPNMALVFAGATLEPYLKSENLDFVGYSQELYEQNRALPEGFYEIGFAAYDYYRQDVQVSNDGWGFYFLAKNEPPLINMPACGSKIQPQYSTPIRFSWLPRNTASLNSSNTTIYRYFLYEVNPPGINPNDVVNSLPPIFIDSTPINQTFYDLMPTVTLLRDSFVYAWRVQAVDVNGADLFRNNGFSEVCTFTWGGPGSNPFGALDSVLNLNAIGETEHKGKMWWTKDVTKFDGYKIHYKKAGNGYDWFTAETENDTLRVLDLEPDTEYECRLQGRKNGSYGMYSEPRYFRTKKRIPVDCNTTTEVPIVTNGRPMLSLLPGTMINYRDFEIRVTDSIRFLSPGHFAGKGEVSLPFLLGLTFAVRFDDITIDDAGVVSNGDVHFVTQDINKWWTDVRQEQEGGAGVGDVITGDDAADHTTTYNIPSINSIQPVIPVVNGTTNIIITRPDGTRDTLKNVPLPYTIKDSDGDLYNVDQNGQVTYIGRSNSIPGLNPAQLNNLELDKGNVVFGPHPAQIYGFDAWQDRFNGINVIAGEYEKLDGGAGNPDYYVSSKAVAAAKTDKILAKITITDNQNYNADSVKFVTGKGTTFISQKTTSGDYEITIIGGPDGDAQELFALHPKTGGGYTSLGKLKIVSYLPQIRKLVLVPVDTVSVNVNEIKSQLKKVYGQIAVSFDVVEDSIYTSRAWDLDDDRKMDVKGSTLLSSYTAEMKALAKQYKQRRGTTDDYAYIFLFKRSNESEVLGDMPRGSQFGYVFVQAHNNDKHIASTVSHEIGHGLFALKHTFDQTLGLAKGTTGNLMDYPNGDSTYKYQWDQIHDPGKVTSIFEGDGDGESRIVHELPEAFLNPDKKTYTFLTPGGDYVTIKADSARRFIFSFGIDKDLEKERNILSGSLVGFTYGNKKYGISWTPSSFGGYKVVAGDGVSTFYDNIRPNNNTTDPTTIIMGFPGMFHFNVFKFDVPGLTNHAIGERPLMTERQFIMDKGIRLFTDSHPISEDSEGDDVHLKLDYPSTVDPSCTYCVSMGVRGDMDKCYSPSEHCSGNKKGLPGTIIRAKWAAIKNYNWDLGNLFEYYVYSGTVPGANYPAIIAMSDIEKELHYLDLMVKFFLDSSMSKFSRLDQANDLTTWLDVTYLVRLFNDNELATIPAERRVFLLRLLTKEKDSDGKVELNSYAETEFPPSLIPSPEKTALRLIETTPDDQVSYVLDELVKQKDYYGTEPSLLAALTRGIDGENFAIFSENIYWMIVLSKLADKFDLTEAIKNEKFLTFDHTFWFNFDKNKKKFASDGRINLKTYDNIIPYIWYDKRNEVLANPYEYVGVIFKHSYTTPFGSKFEAGKFYKIPAYYMYSLFNITNKQRRSKRIRFAVDVALFAIGVGEIRAATKLGRIMLFADMTVGVSYMVINYPLEATLNDYFPGFVDRWNRLCLYYGMGRIGYMAIRGLVYEARRQIRAIQQDQIPFLPSGQMRDELTRVTDDMAKKLDDYAAANGEINLATQVDNYLENEINYWLNSYSSKPIVTEMVQNAGANRAALYHKMYGWEPGVQARLMDKLEETLGRFASTTLKADIRAQPELLDYFNAMHTSFYQKFALRHALLANPPRTPMPESFKAALNDMEYTYKTSAGQVVTKKLGSITNTESVLGTELGKEFAYIADECFRTGNFAKFPQLEQFYRQGYRTALAEVQVKIPGISSADRPILDVSLYKIDQTTGALLRTDVIYLECKIWKGNGGEFDLMTPPQVSFVEAHRDPGFYVPGATELEFEVRSTNQTLLPPGTKLKFSRIRKMYVDFTNNRHTLGETDLYVK